MSGNFTPTGSQYSLDYLTGTMTTSLVSGAPARSTYLMLLTAVPSNPANMSTFTEVSTAGYARQTVSWGAAAVNLGGAYQVANSSPVLFGPFTGISGLGLAAIMCALVTVSTGVSGLPLMLWQFDTAGTAAQNSSLQIPTAELIMSLA